MPIPQPDKRDMSAWVHDSWQASKTTWRGSILSYNCIVTAYYYPLGSCPDSLGGA